jgi:hypothetical protein
MNWDMISAIGSLVAAVAVVISLVYLARQVALSNRLAKSEAWRSRFSDINTLNAAFGVNPLFDQAMTKIYGGALSHNLSKDESSLVNSFIVSLIQVYEQMFHEVEAGVLEVSELDEFSGATTLFQQAYVREMWGN